MRRLLCTGRGNGTLQLDQTVQAIVAGIGQARHLYSRLLLLVGPAGAGKSDALMAVGERLAATPVRVGVSLAQPMLALPARQRPLQVRALLHELVDGAGSGDVVLLDNTELLFEAGLRQDPLRLLQGVARNATVVAAWTGEVRDGTLRYAVPSHPEHRHYPAGDLLIVNVERDDDAP